MIQFSNHITNLLRKFDCVVIPEMGGFVANYSSAHLNRAKGVIYPPSKGIIFNKNLIKNDGLLVSEIAHELTINYNDALKLLNDFVANSKQTLQSGGRIELTGLGYLYLDNEKNVQYLAHQTINFLNDSYGLSPVMAIPIAKKVADEAFDSAICIGCGACVAACKNSSAMLFVSAKVSQFALLPQGMPEKKERVERMVAQMDSEGFGSCTNTYACEAECPKDIKVTNILISR